VQPGERVGARWVAEWDGDAQSDLLIVSASELVISGTHEDALAKDPCGI
jgi:hypothetical protein